MKKIYLILAVAVSIKLFSQAPKVYINLNSHNEADYTNERYDGATRSLYDSAFKYIKIVSDSVIRKKAKYNFQSDVAFLLGCLKWDLKTAVTSSLNLVKWMDNSVYIECDPHSHEGKYGFGPFNFYYNYADVSHLHDSLGVTNRKNVGGCKLDGLQNGNYWRSFETGEAPVRYLLAPSWKPNVLWGCSFKTGIHNDLNTFGSWKPQDSINYGTHVNNRRLALQGNGCEMHFTDTTNEQRIIKELRKLISNVHYSVYPTSGQFYTQSIQFDCRDVIKPNFTNRISTILDSVNKYVALGWAQWNTITEKDQIWKAMPYDSAQYRKDCSALPVGIDEKYIINELGVYPNPTISKLTIAYTSNIETIEVIDALGKTVIIKANINNDRIEINTELFSPGIYFISVHLNNQIIETRKFLKE